MNNSGNIDRSIDIEIGGKRRQLKFPIRAVLDLEKELGKNAFDIALNPPASLSLNEVVTMLYYALRWQAPNITRETVIQWVEEYLDTNETFRLNLLLVCALGYSGLVGDSSVFTQMMARLNKAQQQGEEPAGEQ